MSTPQPIDVSRLKGILGNAKKIMTKIENGDYETGHVDGRALTEDGVKQIQSEGIKRPISQTQPLANELNIKNSRLPESIKRAMIDNPIAQPSGLSHTFTLDDVYDIADEKPMPIPQSMKQPVRENVNTKQALGSYDEDSLRGIIKDVLIEYLSNEYSKNLTESVIKQTINTLLNEGKITTKKKI
jgi:hypothetical protein